MSAGPALALLLVAAEPAPPWATSLELSLVPIPPEENIPDRIRFSHKLHRIRAKAECADCHKSVAAATTAAALSLPKEALCFDGCHDREAERPNCGMCHTNADAPSATFSRARAALHFDHAGHLAREGMSCKTCHPGAEQSADSSERLVPRMEACTACHAADLDRLACRKCHEDLPALASKPAADAVHKAGFFAFHALWGAGTPALCGSCHEQTFCGGCHARTAAVRPSLLRPDRVDRSFIHRGDFLGRHSLEARTSPARCPACHGTAFCRDCHDQEEGGLGGATSRGVRSPHPPEYLEKGSAAFHGRDARIAIESCAACHDRGAASNCVGCHRATGGVGVDIHPPGWSRRDRNEEMGRSRACIPCHGAGP